jgi:transcriptional regulator with XRE-family HTH domain
MPKRTLVASPKGIERAKYALMRKNLTQQALADDIGVASWATISKFFNGIPISYNIFTEICTILDLDWQDIAASSNSDIPEEKETQKTLLTSVEEFWQQLQTLGSRTEKMGLVLVKEETLGWGWQENSPYVKSVSLGSHIRFEVNLESSGYLLLIQKDTSGQVWCFCPSCFAPQPQLDTGKTTLPQEGSPITSFPIEGKPGKEHILAVITKDVPTLDWLPQGSDDPLPLKENHLGQLLEFVNESEECQILYTDYMITASKK